MRRILARCLAPLLVLAWIGGAALAGAVGLPDGEYVPNNFRFSGGSGRVTITCPKLTVSDGGVTATLVFSSPNYPRVTVDGVEYPATHGDGTSAFEVPAPLNADFTVVGTTTAMSQPHDVAYTLHIGLDADSQPAQAAPAGAEQAEPGTERAVSVSERERALPGLVWTSELPLKYATEFAVDYYDGGYKLLTLGDGCRYLVVPEGEEPPAGLDGDVRVLRQPLERIYLAATAAMALFDAVDALDAVRLSGTRAEGWTVENAAAAMERGDMLFAGKYSEPDYELLLTEGCDLAVESTMILHTPRVREMLEGLGVPVLVERSSYESHPLGRTEWVKLYGALLNLEDRAQAFFDGQDRAVSAIRSLPADERAVAFFYVASDGGVVVRGPRDYLAGMIRLAGGRYAFDEALADAPGRSSVTISMEDFYAAAVDADFLIYNGAIDAPLESVGDLLGKSPLFADFRAVREGNVYTTDKSLYQATDVVGEFVLDLNRMLRGEDGDMRFLKKVE